jgi:tRNA-binding EMAP/Myf-like protein
MISYDDFSKVEIKAGKILSAEKIPETDKLVKLSVDFGLIPVVVVPAPVTVPGAETAVAPAPAEPTRDIRQIVSGIAMYFPDPTVLIGKTCMFVTNLEPRKIKGYDSNGMLFALSTKDGKFSLLEPNKDIPEGTRAY